MRAPWIMGALAASALAAPTPAQAARHEVSVLFQGTFHDNTERSNQWFGVHDVPNIGLHGGYAVLQDRARLGLVIDGGWTHGAVAQDLGVRVSQGDTAQVMQTHISLEQFTVGLKGDVDVGNIWYPYLHVQAGVVAAFGSVDDGVRLDQGSNVLTSSGAAPVGIFSVGFELMLPDRKLGWPVTAAIFFEGGYRVAAPIAMGDWGGALDVSGAMSRVGIGIRI